MILSLTDWLKEQDYFRLRSVQLAHVWALVDTLGMRDSAAVLLRRLARYVKLAEERMRDGELHDWLQARFIGSSRDFHNGPSTVRRLVKQRLGAGWWPPEEKLETEANELPELQIVSSNGSSSPPSDQEARAAFVSWVSICRFPC